MKGFDTNTKLSYEKAVEFKNDGYEFAIRYVGRLSTASNDIDPVELKNILKAGLQLGLVQHCPPKPGIFPSAGIGSLWGKNAATFAEAAGYEKGCILYLDLEDVNPEYSKKQADIIAFCNAWYDEVHQAGYVPGIYIGFNTFLTGDQLYKSLKFQHYWKSFSKVPDVTTRGYEMVQLKWITENGIQIDTNEVTGDKLGNRPIFMKQKKSVSQTITLFNDGTYTVN
jgi:hypothetical protein